MIVIRGLLGGAGHMPPVPPMATPVVASSNRLNSVAYKEFKERGRQPVWGTNWFFL